MKNRRLVIIATLAAITLCLGIGFAAVTDVLTIGGTVSAKGSSNMSQWDLKVYFSQVDTPTVTHAVAGGTYPTPATAPTATIAANQDGIEVTVPVDHLVTEGDTVTFTATIRNDSLNYGAQTIVTGSGLAAITDGITASDYYEVTTDWETKTIAKNSSATITVTITLKKTPTTDVAEIAANFTIDLTATAVNDAGTPIES